VAFPAGHSAESALRRSLAVTSHQLKVRTMASLLARLRSIGGSSIEPKLQGHVPALDAIRGLAILGVLLFRFGGGSTGYASAGVPVLPLIDIGARGVDLFFVLSGFLITGILADAKSRPRYFLNFYARRTVRIFPLYYAVLLGTLVVWPALAGFAEELQPAQDNAPWLWLYGANVLQSWRGEWCLGYLNHFWSLAVEEHFYLVWPAVIYCLSRQNAMRACGVLFVAATLGRVAWLKLGGNDVAPEVFTLFRMDGLVAGSWLALAARSEGGLRRFAAPAKAALIATTLLLIPLTIKHVRMLTLVDSLWVLECAALLVVVATAAPATFLARCGESSVLHWLGKYSYGLYVFANLLIPLLAPVVTAGGLASLLGNQFAGQLAYLVLMSAATCGAALASWHLFEKHCLKLKKYFESSTQWQAAGAMQPASAR
jgi:peptidoglycan/LPS O-acetylase OafA/YrhL